MAKEIERKFLVAGEFQNSAENVERITQGYLCSLPERNGSG
jgi:adenylate cyclase